MKPDLDCLFVHTPKADNHYLPLGDFFNITYMPMGLVALANVLRQDGWRSEVVHAGVEWLEDASTTIPEQYAGQRIRAIGISLYWHYQSYDSIEMAREMKRTHPEAFVFLGGVTASYFAEEILKEFPFIDAVVLGHGEGVVRQLMVALSEGDPVAAVPNLAVRVDQNIEFTRGIAFTPGMIPGINDLRYGDLAALRNADRYAQSFGFPLAYGREYTPEENRSMLSMGRSFFPLFTGRGCPWKCTFCGGNQATLRKINGTAKVTWRQPDKVVEDIRAAMDWGYQTMSLCFDPVPWKDDSYVTLFERIQAAKLDVDFYFECWGLPTKRFVDSFRKTFPGPESYLAISPDAGDEAVRKQNKQPFYSDAEMFEALTWIEDAGISVDVFFSLALPGETVESARKTSAMKHTIADRYPNARRVMTWTVQLEPGSPQYERPEAFNMVTDRSGFMDFYEAHGGDRADTYSSLGFKINDYFGDERDEGGIDDFERHLQHLKCMEFCFLAKDPRRWNAPAEGRDHCLSRRQELARRRGHELPQLRIGGDVDYMDALAEERRLRGPRARKSWLRRDP
jgi:radical SAM superfamily enzyme YgiQ (UPF0313 family)